jgi:hypothetical protein
MGNLGHGRCWLTSLGMWFILVSATVVSRYYSHNKDVARVMGVWAYLWGSTCSHGEHFLSISVFWVLANLITEYSCCFWRNRSSGHRCLYNGLPETLAGFLFYLHPLLSWWSQWVMLFLMKVMVWHFVKDSHKVMITLIVVLTSSVIVENSLQFRQYGIEKLM